MDENNTSMNPQPEPAAPQAAPAAMGPMIGVAIILGLIVVGGIYVYGVQLQQEQQDELPFIIGEPEPAPRPTSPADDVSAIEADVESTDLESLEAELDADLKALEGAL